MEWFHEVYKTGNVYASYTKIPEDAQYLGTFYDWKDDSISAIFEHKSFEKANTEYVRGLKSIHIAQVPTVTNLLLEQLRESK